MDNLQILHLSPPPPAFLVPEVLSFSAVGPDELELSFLSLPGHSYAVKATSDLAIDFEEITNLTASEEVTTLRLTRPIVNREFFKVEDLGVAP